MQGIHENFHEITNQIVFGNCLEKQLNNLPCIKLLKMTGFRYHIEVMVL